MDVLEHVFCVWIQFIPTSLYRRRRKNIWSEMESNQGPLASCTQATALTTSPWLLGQSIVWSLPRTLTIDQDYRFSIWAQTKQLCSTILSLYLWTSWKMPQMRCSWIWSECLQQQQWRRDPDNNLQKSLLTSAWTSVGIFEWDQPRQKTPWRHFSPFFCSWLCRVKEHFSLYSVISKARVSNKERVAKDCSVQR